MKYDFSGYLKHSDNEPVFKIYPPLIMNLCSIYTPPLPPLSQDLIVPMFEKN